MTTPTIMLLAFGLAMDAFAVSITNGMCCRSGLLRNALSCGVWFGLFQGLMPLLGYFAGHTFSDMIEVVDHWIALALLGFIGGRMIWEALHAEREVSLSRPMTAGSLAVQAIATSIDALAVGVGLGVMQVRLFTAVGIIAATTFVCCTVGVLLGRVLGDRLSGKAELLGGGILLFIGLHIFVEHIWG